MMYIIKNDGEFYPQLLLEEELYELNLINKVITSNEKIMLNNIGLWKRMSDINFERLKNAFVYIKNDLIYSDNNMYLTVDSLIDINNIITA